MRIGFIAIILLSSSYSFGAETVIEMLNRNGDEMMVFSKKVVHINVGDSVTWKATDKTHSVSFLQGAVPKGVAIYKSPFNQDAHYVFKTPGIYVYKCAAHYGMGMIGVVVVGDDQHNLDSIKALTLMPAPQKQLAKILAQLESSKPGPHTQPSAPQKPTSL